jgi:hypothetical protein
LTHAVWRGNASVWLLRLAVALPAALVFSILNWQRSGKLLLTVTAAQACGLLVGVWLGGGDFDGAGRARYKFCKRREELAMEPP